MSISTVSDPTREARGRGGGGVDSAVGKGVGLADLTIASNES